MEYRPLASLHKLDNNPRYINTDDMERLVTSIRNNANYFEARPLILSNRTGKLVIIAGNMRYEASKQLGLTRVPTFLLENLTEEQEREIIIRDNVNNGEWDWDALANEWKVDDLVEWGVELPVDFGVVEDELKTYDNFEAGALSKEFGVPPFSILDTKQQWWRERKEILTKLIGDSGLGRNDGLLTNGKNSVVNNINAGTSIFDPVLAELLIEWFCPPRGNVLDPFAGGNVRGAVAGLKGRNYVGIDLRAEQIETNRQSIVDLEIEGNVAWVCGDSVNIKSLVVDYHANFILSCPPYHDLEKYSDNAQDLSNMNYSDFLISYKKIIANTFELLENDSFIAWVVGEIRDKNGTYRNFVGDTINAWVQAGANYYNEAILLNAVGTGALRAKKIFNSARKLIKLHQNVLIFVKGDPKLATAKLVECKFKDGLFENVD
jgi:DNA modification methylase